MKVKDSISVPHCCIILDLNKIIIYKQYKHIIYIFYNFFSGKYAKYTCIQI